MEAVTATPLVRRLLEVSAFWALWLVAGLAFHLGAEAYLLLGIPLTAAFQLAVRRRPLADLWARGHRFALDLQSLALALLLAIAPVWSLVKALRGHAWMGSAWSAAAVVGAVPAAFALVRLGRWGARQLALCLLIAGGLGSGLMLFAAVARHFTLHQPMQFDLRRFAMSILLYVPVTFVLEEVSFRGAIDAHLNPPGRWNIGLAIFASALWGLWHLPVVLPTPPPQLAELSPLARAAVTAPSLIVVHVMLGVPLSYFFGRNGNLAVSGVPHAFADAVRNALGLLPGK